MRRTRVQVFRLLFLRLRYLRVGLCTPAKTVSSYLQYVFYLYWPWIWAHKVDTENFPRLFGCLSARWVVIFLILPVEPLLGTIVRYVSFQPGWLDRKWLWKPLHVLCFGVLGITTSESGPTLVHKNPSEKTYVLVRVFELLVLHAEVPLAIRNILLLVAGSSDYHRTRDSLNNTPEHDYV